VEESVTLLAIAIFMQTILKTSSTSSAKSLWHVKRRNKST